MWGICAMQPSEIHTIGSSDEIERPWATLVRAFSPTMNCIHNGAYLDDGPTLDQ